VLVDLKREEIEWIRAITKPRVEADPTGQYGCPSHGIDSKLRSALEGELTAQFESVAKQLGSAPSETEEPTK
jgi:hypothetical protein